MWILAPNTLTSFSRPIQRVDFTKLLGVFTEFTEATRTGGLRKHRQKPYNAYYPNN